MSNQVKFINFKASSGPTHELSKKAPEKNEVEVEKKAHLRVKKKNKNINYNLKLEDGRDRRIIYMDSLFEDVGDVEEKTPQGNLTMKFFEERPWLQRNIMKKTNRIERWFTQANSKPLTISKAESMMQKMGWNGGALGRTGNGIMEPIAPNLTYAMYSKGFGLEQTVKKASDPSKYKQRRDKKKHRRHCFKINVLTTILEFVRNEKEVEILFDCQLHQYQRKHIHHLIEAIREIEGLSDAKLRTETARFLDLVYDITRCNRYQLLTQSEGSMPQRFLCLYKEAPAFMYLVTHLDLRNLKRIVRLPPAEMKKNRRPTRYRNRKKNIFLEEPVRENKNVIDETVLWLFDGIVSTIEDTSEVLASEIGTENEISLKTEEMSTCESDSREDVAKQTSKPEITEKEAAKMEHVRKRNSKTGDLSKNNKFGSREAFESSPMDVTDELIASASIEDADDYDLDTDSNGSDEDGPVIDTDKIYDGYFNNKKYLRNKITTHFTDFVLDDDKTEFKFLGNFNCVEFEVVNEFIKNVWMVLNGRPIDNDDLTMTMTENDMEFSLNEDCNGATTIIKVIEEKNKSDFIEEPMF